MSTHRPRAASVSWRIGPVLEQPLLLDSRHHRHHRKKHHHHHRPPHYPPHVEGILMQLLDSQQVTLSVAGKDKAGKQVDLDPTALVWDVSDETIAALTVNDDGTALLVAEGLGSVVVTLDYTAADGTDFKGSLAVDVVAGPVAEIDVIAGDPVDQA